MGAGACRTRPAETASPQDLGTPSEKIWPGYNELPAVKKMTFTEYPYNNLRKRFGALLSDHGFDLMNKCVGGGARWPRPPGPAHSRPRPTAGPAFPGPNAQPLPVPPARQGSRKCRLPPGS